MTDHEHELVTQLKAMRYDLTALQAKLSAALTTAARLEPPDPHANTCDCGIKFRGPLSLAEHRYHQHDGPLPNHWVTAANLAAPEPDLEEAPPT